MEWNNLEPSQPPWVEFGVLYGSPSFPKLLEMAGEKEVLPAKGSSESGDPLFEFARAHVEFMYPAACAGVFRIMRDEWRVKHEVANG